MIAKSQTENSDKKYRCRFSVVSTIPEIFQEKKSQELELAPASKFLKIVNEKTNQISDYSKGDKLKPNEKAHIFIQLLAKDSSIFNKNQLVRLNLIISDTNSFFPGLDPADLLLGSKKGSDQAAKLAKSICAMTTFNCYMDAMIEVQANGLLRVVDTKLKQFE